MTVETFGDLFAANFADVWRFARRRVDSGPEADDIAAETFAVAWRRRDELPAATARLWLFGVARLVLANHRRDHDRRGRLHLKLAGAAPISTWARPPSDELLWPALAALAEDDRELLLMRAWDELSVPEIADVLEISAANVSSRLHKARRRLDAEIRRRDPDALGHVPVESHGERSHRHGRS
jgi:RNA polymerase sigma-70 factor (ECF subfamily)